VPRLCAFSRRKGGIARTSRQHPPERRVFLPFTPKITSHQQSLRESQYIAVIGRFLEEVINQGRLEAADEIVQEDFIELDPLPGQRQGREGLKEVIAMLRSAFPDKHWVVDESIASGDKAVTRFTWTGTHLSNFVGIPATGRPVKVKGVVIDRLAAGKMSDSHILMDNVAMLQQLGVMPAPGA
jgi:steroid delta-isomerase-like uncharacterized protein